MSHRKIFDKTEDKDDKRVYGLFQPNSELPSFSVIGNFRFPKKNEKAKLVYSAASIDDLLNQISETEVIDLPGKYKVIRFAVRFNSEANVGELVFGKEGYPGWTVPAHYQLVSENPITAKCITAGNAYFTVKNKQHVLYLINHKSGDFRPSFDSLQFALPQFKTLPNIKIPDEDVIVQELNSSGIPIDNHKFSFAKIEQPHATVEAPISDSSKVELVLDIKNKDTHHKLERENEDEKKLRDYLIIAKENEAFLTKKILFILRRMSRKDKDLIKNNISFLQTYFTKQYKSSQVKIYPIDRDDGKTKLQKLDFYVSILKELKENLTLVNQCSNLEDKINYFEKPQTKTEINSFNVMQKIKDRYDYEKKIRDNFIDKLQTYYINRKNEADTKLKNGNHIPYEKNYRWSFFFSLINLGFSAHDKLSLTRKVLRLLTGKEVNADGSFGPEIHYSLFKTNTFDDIKGLKIETNYAYVCCENNLFYVDKKENTCTKVNVHPSVILKFDKLLATNKKPTENTPSVLTEAELYKATSLCPITFTQNELAAARNSTLGEIIESNEKLGLLPAQFINAECEHMKMPVIEYRHRAR